MIERDDKIPDLPVLLAELDRARSIALTARGRVSALAQLQRDLQRHVLNGDAAIADAVNGTAGGSCSDPAGRLLRTPIAPGWPRRSQPTCLICANCSAQRNSAPSRVATSTRIRRSTPRSAGSAIASRTSSSARMPRNRGSRELARWEWALAASFDAQDAAARRHRIPGVGRARRLGRAAPGVSSVGAVPELTDQRAGAVQGAVREQPAPQPAILERAQPWLLWRQDLKTQYRSLEPDETAALAVVRGGGTLRRDVRGIVRMARGRRSAAGGRRHAQAMDRRGTPDRWLPPGLA